MIHFSSFDLIILFFILGAVASWVKSDLEIPASAAKFLSIFLLLSLGLKGGHEVRTAENLAGFFQSFSLGLASCFVIPLVLFFMIKKRLGVADAAALSASYGSVSAVTFITAQNMLENLGIGFSGYMVAIMALMEVPAILVSVFLYQRYTNSSQAVGQTVLKIFSAKSVVLLLGGFVIGLILNDKSWDGISPVVQGCFKGVLAFFLLDLGVTAQKQFHKAWRFKATLVPLGFIFPLLCGTVTMLFGAWAGVSKGDLILLSTLAGSASYIAAPAAVGSSIPTANPSLYLAIPLALSFPMNILIGIPYYVKLSDFIF